MTERGEVIEQMRMRSGSMRRLGCVGYRELVVETAKATEIVTDSATHLTAYRTPLRACGPEAKTMIIRTMYGIVGDIDKEGVKSSPVWRPHNSWTVTMNAVTYTWVEMWRTFTLMDRRLGLRGD